MNDYKIKHIEKPSGITNSPYNMIPYLPDKELFFDSRHWTYGLADGILPFSLTTRISANNQQFLKVSMKESKNDWQTIVGSKQANAFRGHIDGISPCMTEAMGMGGGQIPLLTNATIEESKTDNFMEQVRKQQIDLPDELQGKKFRIRKLTPKECFRLMGVDDKDIDTIQKSGISNSAQYKLAGNSIVVDVLFHLFRKMFIETEPDATKTDAQQLTLF